jgi:hypothetical protein
MKTPHAITFLIILLTTTGIGGVTVSKPDPWQTSEYSVIAIEGRFAVYIGAAPLILDSSGR